MQSNNPNRVRTQISNLDRITQKKSGDQHIEPQGEPLESPHRPHRVSREDMQKMKTRGSEPDESQE